MKVLVISLYYEPDLCQSNVPIIRGLCEDLVRAGHEVTVLTSFPHYSCSAVWPEYRGRIFERDAINGVRVFRSYIYVTDKRSVIGRILNYLSFNLSSTLAGLLTGRQDVIFVMSPPLTIGVTGWLLGCLKRTGFCYNVQDIWPEVAVKLGMLRSRRLISFFEWLEKFIYQRARRLFVISDEFKASLSGKGVPEDKIEVIPNFTDTEFIRPLERDNQFARAHGMTGKFVALYAGNVGLSQGLEVILDAADRLRERRDILFLIVGHGSSRDELIQEAQRRGLENVRFLPLQPEADVPLLYASCDVALIPLRHGITENSVPCKTYSIMAAARPCIAGVDAGSNVWKLIERAGCGVCIPAEDGAALADAVRRMQADEEQRAAMGRNGRAYVVQHFARTAITERYRGALEKLTESPRNALVAEQVSEQ
ncbi:MAG TPA: glycosyltransferase family 4 protein [Blastocatellia bacterium]|nr:glycosyltransferase family 4 protein [Blastocatellia bacterium]